MVKSVCISVLYCLFFIQISEAVFVPQYFSSFWVLFAVLWKFTHSLNNTFNHSFCKLPIKLYRTQKNKIGLWSISETDLSYFDKLYQTVFVLPQGLEPWTPTLRVSCSTNWAREALLQYFKGAFAFVLPQGLEPWTPTLRVSCSTNWAREAVI